MVNEERGAERLETVDAGPWVTVWYNLVDWTARDTGRRHRAGSIGCGARSWPTREAADRWAEEWLRWCGANGHDVAEYLGAARLAEGGAA